MLRSSPSIKILATHLPGRSRQSGRRIRAHGDELATKSAGHMQVGGWISRWSRGHSICPLHLLFALGAIPGHQGEMSRKIRFYYVFSTLGFWTGEFPQHFHKNSLLQKKKVPTRKGGGQNSGPLLSPHPRRTSYVAAAPGLIHSSPHDRNWNKL